MIDGIALIADPWFYAAAVPAVLLTGLAKSGFATGFGALATPLIALAIGVPQAVAVMLPLLLVMDATGLQQLWRQRDPVLLARLLPWGLAGTAVGALLFGVLPVRVVSAVVGGLTLAFLAQRVWTLARLRRLRGLRPLPTDEPALPPVPPSRPPRRWLGAACATTSGFTSFVSHAGGPPLLAYLLPLQLPPPVCAATMAVFFAAMNLAKWLPYALLGLLDARNLATSVLLMPLAPLGVWAGVWLTRRVDARWFYRFALLGMLLTGLKLLGDGLR